MKLTPGITGSSSAQAPRELDDVKPAKPQPKRRASSEDRVEPPPAFATRTPVVFDPVPSQVAAQSQIEVKKAAMAPRATVDRDRFREEMIDLAANGFTEQGQADLVGYLKRAFPSGASMTPDTAKQFAWILAKVRQAVPSHADGRAKILRQFFEERGWRFRVTDGLPPNGAGYQLDRGEFKRSLDAIIDAGGLIEKSDERRLSLMLKDLVDSTDIFLAARAIRSLAKDGRIDGDAASRLLGILDSKTVGSVDMADVVALYREMRANTFAPESVEAFKELLGRNTEDSEVLFFAARLVANGIDAASKLNKHADPKMQAQLQTAQQELLEFLAPRLAGRFDRVGQEKVLKRLLNKGKLTRPEFDALRTAAVTSTTREDYARGVAYAKKTFGFTLRMQDLFYDACAEYVASWCVSVSETRDASGKVLERADERVFKRRLDQLLKLVPEQMRVQRQRKAVLARIETSFAKLFQSNDASERAALARDVATSLMEREDLPARRGTDHWT